MKKIKKVQILSSEMDPLFSFLKDDDTTEVKREKKEASQVNKQYKDHPSKKGVFICWKNKETSEWNIMDFIGFYLNKYVENIGNEDIDFKKKDKKYTYAREKASVIKCLKVYFEGDKERFRNYIEWILSWWVSEDSFTTGSPNIWNVTITGSTVFYKKFEGHEMMQKKPVKKVKKIAKSRIQQDSEMATKDAWDSYFEE